MADVLALREEYRRQNWMAIIHECQESGMTNKAFCVQRGISEKTYYYWLRKIRTAMAVAAEPQLVRLNAPSVTETSRTIHIHYGEAELKLPEDVDLDALSVLLASLRHHD